MKKTNRSMFLSALVVLTYVLSACTGVPAAQSGNGNDQSSQSGQVQDVVFSGTVDSMGGGQWTVSGQAINVDSTTSIDASIVVGDNVKVEARVGQDGSVTAVSIEISGADDANANSNGDNQNDSNANDNASNSNDNQNDNSNSANGNDDNSNGNSNGNSNDNSSSGSDQEVSGVVEAMTTGSITINGVVYKLADFTEFKDLIALGDQVKVHVIVNADGTITIREIEKTAGTGIGGDNSNGNGSNDNSNSNGNDSNSNDDNSNSSNGNDDNGNDNNGNDDNGNDNDNSNDNGGGGNDNGGNGNG
jgi:hypothetical protein